MAVVVVFPRVGVEHASMGRPDAFSISMFLQGLVKSSCNFSTKSERWSFVGFVVREAGVRWLLLMKRWT